MTSNTPTPAEKIAAWSDSLCDLSALGLMYNQNLHDRESFRVCAVRSAATTFTISSSCVSRCLASQTNPRVMPSKAWKSLGLPMASYLLISTLVTPLACRTPSACGAGKGKCISTCRVVWLRKHDIILPTT